MASYQDYQTGICGGGGWWNPGRSLFPPCAAPLSDFMWLDSSLNDMDEQADRMKPAAAASYSRSDESSDDHHYSSSADDQHLHGIVSSDYAQIFQHAKKSQVADFSISEWAENNLLHDSQNMSIFRPVVNDQKSSNNNNNSSNYCFYNQDQFDTTTRETQMGLENNSASSYAYPAFIQSLAGADEANMNHVSDNSFALDNWPKLLMSPSPKQQLIAGTKHTDTNNSMPFWDSWMGNIDQIDTLESHQLVAPPLVEDQKHCNNGNLTSGISLMSPKIGSNDIAHKVAPKRKNNTTSDEPNKRPKFETPSSLPTFKVRKEKLGDRITALQQLVSPFGKTDTASVLHEAIEYIKFLHDQVDVLRTPYMQNGTPTYQGESKNAGSKGPKQDLKSRGLCLVPISSTFPVANETTTDFWTPTLGGTMTFR